MTVDFGRRDQAIDVNAAILPLWLAVGLESYKADLVKSVVTNLSMSQTDLDESAPAGGDHFLAGEQLDLLGFNHRIRPWRGPREALDQLGVFGLALIRPAAVARAI